MLGASITYEIATVAETGKPYDSALLEKVIALRNEMYDNAPELEAPEKIKLRLSGENLVNDPIELKILAIKDGDEVKGFTILETYLDEHGKERAGCMTYASATEEVAKAPDGLAALIDLHKATVEGKDYPIIVEINPGDKNVVARSENKVLHPFALSNNDDALVTEMAIKLGVDPASIPTRLLRTLEKQASGEELSKFGLDEMIELGQLRDPQGKVVSALVPTRYNALALDNVDHNKPFHGGPENLHIALVNAGKGVDYSHAIEAYSALNESIMAGNHEGEEGIHVAEGRAILQQQPEYHQTVNDILTAVERHAHHQHRASLVGEKSNQGIAG